MKEKVLDNKKNGMGMMILFILLYLAAAALTAFGNIIWSYPLLIVGIAWLAIGMDPISWIKGT